MLINTIILFLRDALPIFVISTILISLLQHQGIKPIWYFIAAGVSVIFSFFLLTAIDDISHTIDSTGREWLYACLYIICYFIALVLLMQLPKTQGQLSTRQHWHICLCAGSLMVIVMTLNSANFLIYITGYWFQNNASNVLLAGVILGGGICASIAVLLYFLMAFIERYCRVIAQFLLIFFSAGLLMKATNLLIQIDILSSERFLWDSNHIIIENSELGQLLTVFVGYDATPTMLQLLLYLSAIFIAFGLMFLPTVISKQSRTITLPKEAA